LAEINIETDIITSIAASLIDWCSDTSLVLIYDKTFKTDAIVFIGKRHNVFDLKLSDNVTVSGVNSLMLTISLCEIFLGVNSLILTISLCEIFLGVNSLILTISLCEIFLGVN
jgi:hypothetical protein